MKRVFKSKGVENVVASNRNLHLEDGVPRKRSEVQMYMILYYDTRIRETVLKRWAEEGKPGLESTAQVNIQENEIEPYESFDMKDTKVPIWFKHSVALKLYEAEPEEVKVEVRSKREAWHEDGRTVHTADNEERLNLIRDYQKYVHILLHHSCIV